MLYLLMLFNRKWICTRWLYVIFKLQNLILEINFSILTNCFLDSQLSYVPDDGAILVYDATNEDSFNSIFSQTIKMPKSVACFMLLLSLSE